MPKVFYCLKCSTAKYKHSRWCLTIKRPDLEYSHELIDLRRKPYCSWDRDYIRLRRVYIRKYNPDGWNAVGWYCPNCGNFIKTN